MVDDSKMVPALGTKSPVPVEVVQFGWAVHGAFMESCGADPVLRVGPDGEPMVTDNGNYIIDCHFEGGMDDAEVFECAIRARAGVVESGLFLGMATEVLVSGAAGVRTLTKGDVP
jgi:ribose 5-phosphate isomerase A